jgi:hypothetical protein
MEWVFEGYECRCGYKTKWLIRILIHVGRKGCHREKIT